MHRRDICAVTIVSLLLILTLVAGRMASAEGEKPSSDAGKQAVKEALAEFNDLIGGWRGVGMPKRGSRVGAWIEKAEWIWDFDKDEVALTYTVDGGKLLQSARVTYDPKQKQYRLAARFSGKVDRTYTGKLDDKKKLVLESAADKSGYVYRITVTRLNEKRTLVLHEKRRATQTFYSRIAEVGYTRAGTSLAVSGAGEIECIVTGGKGTMAVSYKGQTYYVCCSGCRQAFEDDPEGIIAEYKKTVAERKAAK